MKRVVLASFDVVPSAKGASRHILQNAEALREHYDVSLVTLGDVPLPGRRHLPIRLREPNWLRRAIAFHKRALSIFAKNPFDLYHVRSPFEGLAVPPGETILYEVNGLSSVEAQSRHPALYTRPDLREKLRAQELLLLDRAALVLTPSEVTRAFLVDLGAAPESVLVVPNAPTIPLGKAPESAERDGPLRCVYVGTLSSWQGLDLALRAMVRSSVRFELEVRTPAPERDRRALSRLAERLGCLPNVRIDGPLDPSDLGAFLRSQDVGLAPLAACERNLVQGGMPLKILDYMAAGLPVLSPEMPIVRAIVGSDYPTYRRSAESDCAALFEALARSPKMRAELSSRGHARVRQHFSPEAQREALLAAYRRIAS